MKNEVNLKEQRTDLSRIFRPKRKMVAGGCMRFITYTLHQIL